MRYGLTKEATAAMEAVLRGISAFGSPVENLAVISGASVVEPTKAAVDRSELLLYRKLAGEPESGRVDVMVCGPT